MGRLKRWEDAGLEAVSAEWFEEKFLELADELLLHSDSLVRGVYRVHDLQERRSGKLVAFKFSLNFGGGERVHGNYVTVDSDGEAAVKLCPEIAGFGIEEALEDALTERVGAIDADEVLDKITKHGIGSLSDAERRAIGKTEGHEWQAHNGSVVALSVVMPDLSSVLPGLGEADSVIVLADRVYSSMSEVRALASKVRVPERLTVSEIKVVPGAEHTRWLVATVEERELVGRLSRFFVSGTENSCKATLPGVVLKRAEDVTPLGTVASGLRAIARVVGLRYYDPSGRSFELD